MAEPSDDALAGYRDWLLRAEHKASRDFDKAIMTLSAGALAVSVAFIRDLVPAPHPATVKWLAWAWTLFALSLVFILISFLTSQGALRKAIEQADRREIYRQFPGGFLTRVTIGLNITAAITFVLGVFALLYFARLNLGGC